MGREIESVTIGRSEQCDIRVNLKYVSRIHAEIKIDHFSKKVLLTNFSRVNPTLLNEKDMCSFAILNHNDIFTVGDRSFRFEYSSLQLQKQHNLNDGVSNIHYDNH